MMSTALAGVLGQQNADAGGISRVAVGTYAENAGTGNLTLTFPAGTTTGDTVLALINLSDDVSINVPTGWTLVWQEGSATDADNQTGMLYRDVDGTEGGSVTFTNHSVNQGGVLVTYRGVDSVADTSANDGRAGGGASTSNPNYAGTLPTVASGDWLISGMGFRSGGEFTFAITGTNTVIFDHDSTSLLNCAPIALAESGSLASAPSIATWSYENNGTGRGTYGVVLLKAS